ncbi:MAG: ASCH domain-containing protein [Phenylobacterium sp.]|uniref:ASCH domain-containing protein n=1 Tax=Phenylobacterium sp. TaxID=1871053 RepID=UPI00391B0B2E
MLDDDSIMLSVAPDYARAIVTGLKSVELRRRAPRISRGTRAWLYSTLPVGQVVAVLTIDEVVEAPLTDLWQRYASRAAIAREDFDAYFAGLSQGAALIIREVQALKSPVSLSEMREGGAFQPPQFYRRVRAGAPEARLSKSELHPALRLAVG